MSVKPQEWRNLTRVVRSESSLSGKAACHMIPRLWHSGKGETMATVSGSGVAARLGVREETWVMREGAHGVSRAVSDSVTRDTCHPTSVAPIEHTTRSVNPGVNYRR